MNTSKKEYIIKSAIISVDNYYPCLKQPVYAMIEKDGKRVFGTNRILNNEIKECPRDLQGYVSGAGYQLCSEICNQISHAEVEAIENAKAQGIDISGGKLTLVGHTYCCDNCKNELEGVDINDVEFLN